MSERGEWGRAEKVACVLIMIYLFGAAFMIGAVIWRVAS